MAPESIAAHPRPHRKGPLQRAPRPQDRTRPDLSLDLPGVASDEPLDPGRITLLWTQRGAEDVRHRLVLDCAQRGWLVLHALGATPLDSTGLARRALAQGLDPAYALSASRLTRAFTAYQLAAYLEERLPSELDALERVALVVAVDPLGLYTDEDVPRDEGLTLARHGLASLERSVRRHEVPALVVQAPVGDPAFERLLSDRAHRDLRVEPHPREGVWVQRGEDAPRRHRATPRWDQSRLEAFGLREAARAEGTTGG